MANAKATVLDKKVAGEEMTKNLELGMPGAEHKLLAKLAGKWVTKIKTWNEPGGTPMEGTGTSEARMIFEGRFLQQTEAWDKPMMGKRYSGMGIIGFDNHTKKHVSTWFDNFGTAILLFEEIVGTDPTSMVMEARHLNAIAGAVLYRTVKTTIDDNNYTLDLYMIDKSRIQFKMMEIRYTRKSRGF
jgi:hypothetical protein